MEEKNQSRYIRGLEKTALKFTMIYEVVVFLVYIIISLYLIIHLYSSFDNDNSLNESLYTVIPLIAVSVMGVFSKELYFNILDYIFRFDRDSMTFAVKRHKAIFQMIVNVFTINILLSLALVLVGDNNFILLLVISILVLSITLLVMIGAIVGIYENLSNIKKMKRERY